MKPIYILILMAVLLVSCQVSTTKTQTLLAPVATSSVSVSTEIIATETLEPTNTQPLPILTPTLEPSPSLAPSPKVISECVTLIYEDNAQLEFITKDAGRVLIDVYDPALLSAPADESDILLTTHTHWDHIQADFQSNFPGEQLFTKVGTLSRDGIAIQGIASAHNEGDRFKPEGGTNYIYLIEIAGLRIAHFGDIGQNALTDEQLEILLPLDVAIIQIANSYSDMSAQNQKGIDLISQINPKWVIPTHANLDTAALAVAQWPGWYHEEPAVEICRPDLPIETQILFLGQWAEKFPKYLDLQPYP